MRAGACPLPRERHARPPLTGRPLRRRGLSKLNSLGAAAPRGAGNGGCRCDSRRALELGRHPEVPSNEKGACGGWSHRIPRKEVIQPQLPLRLPCYDFTPITDSTFGRCLPCGLAHGLRAFPAFVV